MVSGKVITTVVEMVVAILALVVLWIVLSKLFPALSDVSEKVVMKFKTMVCDIIPGLGTLAKLLGRC